MQYEIRMTETSAALGDDERASGGRHVSGLAIVVDEPTEIYPGLVETIKAGAVEFAPTVRAFVNHDPAAVLSSTDSRPPLEITESRRGVHYKSPIPGTSYGKDLIENLSRQNIGGSSFSFEVQPGGDKLWEDDQGVLHREINSLTLHELGPVVMPAYPQTTAHSQARDMMQAWKELQQPGPVRPTLHLNGKSRDPISPALRAQLDQTENEAMGFLVPLNEQQRQRMNLTRGRRRSESELLVRHGRLRAELDL